jgi:hypothetical protein
VSLEAFNAGPSLPSKTAPLKLSWLLMCVPIRQLAGSAADIHRGPAAGGQVMQDPAVEVLIVIPRMPRVNPGRFPR